MGANLGSDRRRYGPVTQVSSRLLIGAALAAISVSAAGCTGNVEGTDLLTGSVDVIVTDGFTGNVALKTLEGSLRFLFDTMLGVFGTDDATREAAHVLLSGYIACDGHRAIRARASGSNDALELAYISTREHNAPVGLE